jgi:hypothetical protein
MIGFRASMMDFCGRQSQLGLSRIAVALQNRKNFSRRSRPQFSAQMSPFLEFQGYALRSWRIVTEQGWALIRGFVRAFVHSFEQVGGALRGRAPFLHFRSKAGGLVH